MRAGPLSAAVAGLLLWGTPADAAVSLTPAGTFAKPVFVTAPAGDTHRLFVVQRLGRVLVVKDGTVLATPFLDISGAALSGQAFTALAFAPDYERSGRVYALYTVALGESDQEHVILDEFTRSTSHPDRADPASRRTVLDLDISGSSAHDSGQAEFGPDGVLYVTIGDGVDHRERARDPESPNGKVLRIDPRPGAAGTPEVLAGGLRNPWRFAFDAAHDSMLIGDVGETENEEVDRIALHGGLGLDFGWPCWEGTSATGQCEATGTVFPLFEYSHDEGRCAILAGRMVRDPGLPSLAGRFVYGDWCTGELRSLIPTEDPAAQDERGTGASVPITGFASGLSSFGEDDCGHLYVTRENGQLYRVDESVFTPCSEAPTVDLAGDRLDYEEDSGPLAVDADLELSDTDSAMLAGATVRIGPGFAPGEDVLTFDDRSGIAGSYDPWAGALTLTGAATVADYREALRSVAYENDSDDPSATPRTVSLQTTDAGASASSVATRAIAVTPVDDPPALKTSPGPARYAGPPVPVDPGLALTDPDDGVLTGARVRIVSGLEAGDRLQFAPREGIAGSYGAGTLTLMGRATVAAYRRALRQVRFHTTGLRSAAARTVELRAGDGTRTSAPARRRIALACAGIRVGTPRDDRLTGGVAGNLLRGLAGDDSLAGRAGDDCLFGGRGDDRLRGGRGNDRLLGGPGNDHLTGDGGRDVMDCGPGVDRAVVDARDDVIRCEHVILR